MNSVKLYLLDGHSLTFKAYYAIRNLTSPHGEPTGAVYGFFRMLLKYIKEQQPTHLAVIFDTPKPTFRKDLYAEYKANREAPPEDFGVQMGWIYELIRGMGIPIYDLEGFEADDLIGTITHTMGKAALGHSIIISADKDLLQLVDETTTMLRPGTKGDRVYDAAVVEEELGIRPDQMVDWLAMVGDSSDNIPGIPGIGPKSATLLLQEFGSLDAVLADPTQVKKPKQRESIAENVDKARLARQLATIKCDVEFDWSLDACKLPENLWTQPVISQMHALGFDSIIREFAGEANIPKSGPVAAPVASTPNRIPSTSAISAPEQVQPDMFSIEPEPSSVVEIDYKVIFKEADLESWIADAMIADWVALDTETTSTDVMSAQLVGISLCCKTGVSRYVPVGHRPEYSVDNQLPLDRVRGLLQPLFDKARLTAHHAKFDWKILIRAGFIMPEPAFDSMLASYLLNPDRFSGHGLKALGQELCGITMKPIKELIGSGAKSITFDMVDVLEGGQYACADADVTLRLTEILSRKIREFPALEKLLQNIEIPLSKALIEMELGGFRLEPEVLRTLGVKVLGLRNTIQNKIWEAAGHPFNIGSPKQVSEVLYEELGLPTGKKTKTGFSTNEAELERLSSKHPVPRFILEYREYEKLQSTYIDTLPRLIHSETGRIHTSFNQTIAATGRLSSTEPNLQNIPIRTELGREIRRAFVADREDHQLIKADYSQIELRILAHVSGDENLKLAYSEGRDIHRQTASEVFGVPPEQVEPQMRAEAKIINFGIIYGMSAHGLAQQLGTGRQKAAQFIDRYFNTYPGVRAWIDRLLHDARRAGYVETLMGRRRWLPDLTAKSGMLRSNAERVAVNTPIQGTSADMIKLAMLRIHEGLHGIEPKARMVCQVHDELVFSVPEDRVNEVRTFVVNVMENALPLDVPVIVETSQARNWADCR